MNIMAFFIGVATAYFALNAYMQLRGFGVARSRFHNILGWIFVYWAFSNLKDLVQTVPGLYTRKTLDTILIIDGWSAITFACFLFELTMPGWVKAKRVALLAAPFLFFTVIYAVTGSHMAVVADSCFLGIFGIAVLSVGYTKATRYIKYIKENYSNIDEMDISWLKPVYILCFLNQLLWLITSHAGQVVTDCLYYIIEIATWQMIIVHCRKLKQVTPVYNEEHVHESRSYCFADNLDRIVTDERLYLNSNLSLDDIVRRLNTNRTYLSEYFNNVLGTTFYDYINTMRIEKKSIPLMNEHPEYTLEYIAMRSGFNTLSTFRRAFTKCTGKKPRQYRDGLLAG